ncbi:hypothetical protein LINPERPRIM_LOCUS11155, partial [Linum perenne]
ANRGGVGCLDGGTCQILKPSYLSDQRIIPTNRPNISAENYLRNQGFHAIGLKWKGNDAITSRQLQEESKKRSTNNKKTKETDVAE